VPRSRWNLQFVTAATDARHGPLYLAIGIGIFLLLRWPLVLVTHEHNGEILMATYRFSEEPFKHPRLALLRKREHLDEVIQSGKNEFEKAVLLRGWTRRQWETKTPFYYPPWDAVEILDLARQGFSRGFCAQYAIVYLQACQSVGIHARYVDLAGHFVTAIWSDDYNRWVVMDPTADVHYERMGVPLHGGDLSKAYWNRRFQNIFKVSSNGRRSHVNLSDLAPFRSYSIVKVADQLSYPTEVVIDGKSRLLRHDPDYRHYPLVGRDRLGVVSSFLEWKTPDPTRLDDRPLTSDADEFRYRMNQTLIRLARTDPVNGFVKVALTAENAATFDHFLINAGTPGWQRIKGNNLKWLLSPGFNRLRGRIETSGGWQGPVSEITVFYKPPYLAKR
jgi:hypothetical protein